MNEGGAIYARWSKGKKEKKGGERAVGSEGCELCG